MRLPEIFFLFLIIPSLALADDSNSALQDANPSVTAGNTVPSDIDSNGFAQGLDSGGNTVEVEFGLNSSVIMADENSGADQNVSAPPELIADLNVSGETAADASTAVDANISIDANTVIDANIAADANASTDPDASVDMNAGVVADANSENLPVADVNAPSGTPGPDISAQQTPQPQAGISIGSLAQFFSQGIADLFSGLRAALPLDSLLGGFIDISEESRKGFVLNESIVEVNGELAKCIGDACDEVPDQVE